MTPKLFVFLFLGGTLCLANPPKETSNTSFGKSLYDYLVVIRFAEVCKYFTFNEESGLEVPTYHVLKFKSRWLDRLAREGAPKEEEIQKVADPALKTELSRLQLLLTHTPFFSETDDLDMLIKRVQRKLTLLKEVAETVEQVLLPRAADNWKNHLETVEPFFEDFLTMTPLKKRSPASEGAKSIPEVVISHQTFSAPSADNIPTDLLAQYRAMSEFFDRRQQLYEQQKRWLTDFAKSLFIKGPDGNFWIKFSSDAIAVTQAEGDFLEEKLTDLYLQSAFNHAPRHFDVGLEVRKIANEKKQGWWKKYDLSRFTLRLVVYGIGGSTATGWISFSAKTSEAALSLDKSTKKVLTKWFSEAHKEVLERLKAKEEQYWRQVHALNNLCAQLIVSQAGGKWGERLLED